MTALLLTFLAAFSGTSTAFVVLLALVALARRARRRNQARDLVAGAEAHLKRRAK